MKEIKAYVHRNRIGPVVAALKESAAWSAAGNSEHNLTVYMVKGMLVPLDAHEVQFSLEVGEEMVNEYKLELHCADDHAPLLVDIIRANGRSGKGTSGWIYVSEIMDAVAIV